MILFGILVVSIFAIVTFRYPLLRMLGKDPTMTGRTQLWASLIPSILKHPVNGYGYMAFWQGLSGESANVTLQLQSQFGLGYAENGVVELFLQLGAVGVLLYALVFLRAMKDAIYCFRREPSPAILWCISMLFLVAVSNLAGGALLSPMNIVCILPFIAYITLRSEAERIRRSRTFVNVATQELSRIEV
jgi:O-antigen ligase